MSTLKRFNIFLIISLLAFVAAFGKVFSSVYPENSGIFSSVIHAQEESSIDTNPTEKIPQLKSVTIEIFWSYGCPHCAKEREFLAELAQNTENIIVKDYEVSRNTENLMILGSYGEKFSTNVSGVPFTVIDQSDHITGFRSPETTGLQIINKIRKIWGFKPLEELDWEQIESPLETETEPEDNDPGPTPPPPKPNPTEEEPNTVTIIPPNSGTEAPKEEEKINVPFLKEIDPKKVSLPLLTVALALADGFNPCAMWVLLFLISLLIGVENPKRRWLIGGAFILTSGIVYFLFLTAWLEFFKFVGFVKWTQYLIGTVALGAAFIYLKDVIQNRGGCKVVGGNENRKRIFEKLREYALKDNLLVAMGGIMLMAFGVNLVEFFCSAGLPATYSNILAMNNLNSMAYYGYMLLYVVIFMIDDFTIFAIAMITLRAVGMENKYARLAHLVGGLLMLFIGLSMFFKPELLMFG